MLRIVGSLTVLLALVAGCSQETAENTISKVPAADRTPTGSNDGGGDAQTPPEASGTSAEAKSAGGSGKRAADQKTDPESKKPVEPVDTQTRAAVLKLLDQMGSDAELERSTASKQLDELGEAAMPSVVLGLREGTVVQQRGAAAYLVGRVSPRDEEAATALVQSLSAGDAALSNASLMAVEKMVDEQLVAALPALVAFATNQEQEEVYRSRAIRAITQLNARAEEAAEPMIQLALQDPSLSVRKACFFSISKIAPREVAEQFYQTRLASDAQADLRRLAAKWLAGVARSDRSLECLVAALNDPDESVRFEVVDAMVELGKPALPSLVKALDSDDVQTRRHAALAIGKMGLLAVDAKGALEKRLDDPDEQVRELARAALKALN